MANNFVVKDGTGTLITFVSFDTGGGVQLAESCPNDGTNKMTTLFDLDTDGPTTQWNLGVGLRLSASGGSIEAKGQKAMASSIPVVIASDQSAFTVTVAAGAAVIGHVIVDSGTLTTVGTVTTVTTVTTVSAVTAITNALPAGSNTIGGVNIINDVASSGLNLAGVAPASATAFGSNVCTRGIEIKADDDNTNSIYVGFSNAITADSGASTSGFRLKAGQAVFIPVSNTNLIFLLRGAASQNYCCLVN